MKEPNIEEVIREGKVIIHPGRYVYLKSKDNDLDGHFLVAQDMDEITVITEESNLSNVEYYESEKWFKLFEIKVSVPFLAGFLSKVIKPIADAGYNTLIVSTFSKDYILTKEETFVEVAKILEKLGFQVEIKEYTI